MIHANFFQPGSVCWAFQHFYFYNILLICLFISLHGIAQAAKPSCYGSQIIFLLEGMKVSVTTLCFM